MPKRNPKAKPPIDVNDPPPGTWFWDDGVEKVIGSTTRSPMAFFLVPFSLLCFYVWFRGFVTQATYQTLTTKDLFVLAVLFVFATALLTSSLLLTLGHTEVRIRGNDGRIFTGIGMIGLRRSFHVSAVKDVCDTPTWWEKNNRPARAICIECSTRLKFGSLLSDRRRRFFIAALQRALVLQSEQIQR